VRTCGSSYAVDEYSIGVMSKLALLAWGLFKNEKDLNSI
jgi:hypothetical protein